MSVTVKLIRFLIYILVALLLSFCLLFAILQTKWAKDQIRIKIMAYLQEFGTEAKIEPLTGRLPFSWEIPEAQFRLDNGDSVQLSDLKLRIAILPLLRGKIVINYLNVERLVYTSSPQAPPIDFSKTWLREQLEGISLPCRIDIHRFQIERLEVNTWTTGMTGSIAMRRDLHAFRLELSLFSPQDKKTYFNARLYGSQLRNFIEVNVQADLKGIDSVLKLEGPWTTWKEFLYDVPRTGNPLQGQWKGEFAGVPQIPLLNRDWKFKTEFSVLSGQ